MLLDEVKETIARLEKWKVQLTVDEQQWAGQGPGINSPEMLRYALADGIRFIQATREWLEESIAFLKTIEATLEGLADFGNKYYKDLQDGERRG